MVFITLGRNRFKPHDDDVVLGPFTEVRMMAEGICADEIIVCREHRPRMGPTVYQTGPHAEGSMWRGRSRSLTITSTREKSEA